MKIIGLHDPACHVANFIRRHEPRSVDADNLECREARFQHLPAPRVGGQQQATGMVPAHVLAANLLDLVVELNRIGLQRGNVGVRIQGEIPCRSVPCGASGQLGTLNQQDILPAEFC